MERRLLTWGYARRTPGDLEAVIHDHGITYIADVRRDTDSPRRPEFSAAGLRSFLAGSGCRYALWGESLGGPPGLAQRHWHGGCRKLAALLRQGHRVLLLSLERRAEDGRRAAIAERVACYVHCVVVHL